MADDEFFLTIRGIGAPPGYFFPVRAADAHAYDLDLYLIRAGDGGFGPVDDLRASRTRNNRNRFHKCSFSSISFRPIETVKVV